MNRKEIVNNINAVKVQIKSLEAKLNSHEEQLKKYDSLNYNPLWQPKENETYYYIANDGSICQSNNNNSKIDKNRMAFGNVFQTEEIAEKIRDRQQLRFDMLKFKEQYDSKPIDDEKWFIDYHNLSTSHATLKETSDIIYFNDINVADDAIREFGKRIKELY